MKKVDLLVILAHLYFYNFYNYKILAATNIVLKV